MTFTEGMKSKMFITLSDFLIVLEDLKFIQYSVQQ